MNLDFAKVCGKHIAVYEAYYKQIDPKSSGAIEAMTAAKFLKKSGLSDVVLSRVWDLSDPNGKGFLDKPGFFVALKLVSLAQAGLVINMSNIYVDTANPPKVGDLPKIMPPRVQALPVGNRDASSSDWTISVIDRLKYEQLFESLKPVGGMLPGNKVKGVLMDSKLPMDTLGKIWDLADQDKDGNLDKHEFIVAMHIVYQTLDKRTVPDMLPMELRKAGNNPPPPKPAPPAIIPVGISAMPRAPSGECFGDAGFVANFPKDIAPPPAIPPLPVAVPAAMTRLPTMCISQPLISTDPLISIGAPPSQIATADWVVVPSELKRYEVIFRDSDRDKDGLVSGIEVKNVFLQSGVSQNCLAHIWALCDTNQSGKLTLEQFALAMWMVERKQNGIEPPQVLTAEMVAPSMRTTVSGADLQSQAESKPTYSNPELNMISKEIEELCNERRTLETEIAQRETDIRIKSGEVRSLQSELDTLSATLKQLENQRGEAQKRLDDLKAQVNKIREQCQKQEDTINEQEGELNAKRSELQKLKDEEAALQKEYDENNRELLTLTHHLQNTQLKISSVRSMVSQLMETHRQMTDALLMCRAAIDSQNGDLVSEYQLKIEPDFSESRKTLEQNRSDIEAKTETHDPFANGSGATNGFATNGFGGDPFVANNLSSGHHGAFDESFSGSRGFDSAFNAFDNSGQKNEIFGEAFGSSRKVPYAENTQEGKDDFGSDPFAALHAPTGQGQVLSPNAQRSLPPPRPESPSPALPPKKSKVPPPRPAPPRPVQAPGRPNPMDSSGPTSTGASGSFADFADFDNKISNIPTQHQTASGPTDFSDDPFKDYRYEDPFNIADPFADNSDNDCGFQNSDALFNDAPGSEDGGKKHHPIVTISRTSELNESNTSQSFDTAASNTPLSGEILKKLETCTTNSDTQYTLHKETTFANFDAFLLSSGAQTVSNNTNNNTIAPLVVAKTSIDVENGSRKECFFNAFNEHFDSNSNVNTAKGPAISKISDAFSNGSIDAFGSATNISYPMDSNVFNEFNENQFEDDFFHLQSKNCDVFTASNVKISKNRPAAVMTTPTSVERKQCAANKSQSDAFNVSPDSDFKTALNNSKNFQSSGIGSFKVGPLPSISVSAPPCVKVQNKSAGSERIWSSASVDSNDKHAAKFTADYSKPESFDADLEEVLKRSVIDK